MIKLIITQDKILLCYIFDVSKLKLIFYSKLKENSLKKELDQ